MPRRSHKARRRHFGFRRHFHRSHAKPSIAVLAGTGAALYAPLGYAMRKGGGAQDVASNFVDGLMYNMIGYAPISNQTGSSGLKNFWVPVAGGFAAHYVASKVGINRTLARMKIPFSI